MTAESLQAWILHKQWSGESSARVSFFTEEFGLLPCLCKGGRTPKKQAILQSFVPLWIVVDQRYDRHYMRSMESMLPLTLRGHALFSAWYINELLYYLLKPLSPEASLYQAYSHTLHALATTSDQLAVEVLLRRFEWALLKACGYCFSWTQEAARGDPIVASACYQWVAGQGFLLANQGIPGEHLIAIAADNFSEIAYLKSAKIIMRKAIDHLLCGKKIQARALFCNP